ncbi:MAG: M48 family metalloprotease [Desulfobacterales bacterium]|nr:MAG: M48 family metalloprotease [Desulfobacterales bacterium]
MTRPQFLGIASILISGLLFGCATDPVTGKQQFMLVSEEEEIQIDKKYSPFQFSADYGPTQDQKLNAYIDQIGKKIADITHRPHMPYSFRVVNASYVNAYAFPGGSIAVTRGILLKIENEAELAGLLGLMLGHVNLRHSAKQMSQGMLTQAAVGGMSILAESQGTVYGYSAVQPESTGTGVRRKPDSWKSLREADALGMEYMVKAGYGPEGYVGLMDMLNNISINRPAADAVPFPTQPLSDERYQTAVQASQTKYKSAKNRPLYGERYMDHTANLRSKKEAIEEMQKGEDKMVLKKYSDAENHFRKALEKAPNDYAALVMMSKCQLAQKKWAVGRQYAEIAQQVYPQEAQAYHLSGFAKIQLKDYEEALEEFNRYDQVLAGNPNSFFFKGYCYEGMQQYPQAGREYQHYLQVVNQGDYANHAYRRVREWQAKGYL